MLTFLACPLFVLKYQASLFCRYPYHHRAMRHQRRLVVASLILAPLMIAISSSASAASMKGIGPRFYVASSLPQSHNKSYLVLRSLGSRHNQSSIVKPDYVDYEAAQEIVACATTGLLGFKLCHTEAHGISIPMANGPDFRWDPSVLDEILHECSLHSKAYCQKAPRDVLTWAQP